MERDCSCLMWTCWVGEGENILARGGVKWCSSIYLISSLMEVLECINSHPLQHSRNISIVMSKGVLASVVLCHVCEKIARRAERAFCPFYEVNETVLASGEYLEPVTYTQCHCSTRNDDNVHKSTPMMVTMTTSIKQSFSWNSVFYKAEETFSFKYQSCTHWCLKRKN